MTGAVTEVMTRLDIKLFCSLAILIGFQPPRQTVFISPLHHGHFSPYSLTTASSEKLDLFFIYK